MCVQGRRSSGGDTESVNRGGLDVGSARLCVCGLCEAQFISRTLPSGPPPALMSLVEGNTAGAEIIRGHRESGGGGQRVEITLEFDNRG